VSDDVWIEIKTVALLNTIERAGGESDIETRIHPRLSRI
jgi:hypothetical protein